MLSSSYKSKSEQKTIEFAENFAARLGYKGVICLYGEIGAGKTIFAKGCAQALGIKKSEIKSPTFSFIREYKSKKGKIFHCDFYRINNDDEILHHSLSEILADKSALVVIEWADNLKFALPKERIDIHFSYKGKTLRDLKISFLNDITWIKKLYHEYSTPPHVQKHMSVVAGLALKIAKKFIKRGVAVDLKFAQELALLHDLMKAITFKNRRKNDVKVTSDILKKLGRRDLAKSVLTQRFGATPRTIEEKIVYYADKRVKHRKIVSLKERFKDGRKRYFPDGKIPAATQKIEKKIFALERSLHANC